MIIDDNLYWNMYVYEMYIEITRIRRYDKKKQMIVWMSECICASIKWLLI